MYMIKEILLFSPENLLESPLVTENTLFSQFALNFDQYRDNNNYLVTHEVTTSDNRYIGQEMKEIFIDVEQMPSWVLNQKLVVTNNISRDDGSSYFMQEHHVFLGIYFFVSDFIVKDSRSVWSIIQLISDFGGL